MTAARPGDQTADARECQLYFPGHTTHWIQVIHSAAEPHDPGVLVAVEGNLLTVDLEGEVRQYRTHHPQRVLDIIGIGGALEVNAEWSILWKRSGDQANAIPVCSIAKAKTPWTPCDFAPLEDVSFEGLAERTRTHGGFSVPGSRVVGGAP